MGDHISVTGETVKGLRKFIAEDDEEKEDEDLRPKRRRTSDRPFSQGLHLSPTQEDPACHANDDNDEDDSEEEADEREEDGDSDDSDGDEEDDGGDEIEDGVDDTTNIAHQ